MRRFRMAGLLVAACVLAAVPGARAQTSPLPSRLPADTVFYLYSRGTGSIARASRNPLARLWNDPAFAPARRLLEQGLVDAVAHNPRLARIPSKDLDALLVHPAIFGIRLTQQKVAKGQGKSVGRGFLVVEAGAKEGAEIRASLARAEPKAAAHMRLTEAGFLVFSDDPATLALLAAHFSSAAPAATSSLATLASYREAATELSGRPTVEFFLHVPAISRLHPQVRKGFDTGAFLHTLHIEQVHLLCGSVDLNAPASLMHFAILGDTAPGSLFDLFGPNVASFPTLAAAPASSSYVVNRLNVGAALSVLTEALTAAMPKRQGARMEMISGLLSSAVVPALGGEYASIAPRPGTHGPPIFAMTVHEQAAAKLFGSTLAPFLEPAGVESSIHYYRFQPHNSHKTAAPAKKGLGASPAKHHRAHGLPSFIALTPHLLLMSRNEALVRREARAVTSAKPPAGLAGVRQFRAARASMPARLAGFGYVNLQGIDWTKLFEDGAERAARNKKKNPRSARRAAALAKWARGGGSVVVARHLHLFVLGAWKDSRGMHWRGDLH